MTTGRSTVLVVAADPETARVGELLARDFDVTVVRDLPGAEAELARTGPLAVVLPVALAAPWRRRVRGGPMLVALAGYDQAELIGRWDELDDGYCLFPREDASELPDLLHHLERQRERGTAHHLRIVEHNRRLGTPLHRAVSYLGAAHLLGIPWGLFVHLGFRWEVEGEEHLHAARRQGRSVLLAVNHPRETDAPLYCYRLFWPAGLVDLSCQPSLLVGGRIYARSRLVRLFSYVYKFYIVNHGMGPLQLAVLKFVDDLRRRPGIYIVYPEGPPTDDDHEELRSPRPGIGYIAYHSDAIVLPVVTEGVSRVFPRSFTWPRPFQSLRLAIGAPIDVAGHRARPATRETIDDLTRHIFAHLVRLKYGPGGAGEPPRT